MADNSYTGAFNSYSGTDIRAIISVPRAGNQKPTTQVLATLQTISYSIFRDKQPVRALGYVGEKGRTRGTRTIAGSMVFTVFDRHVLLDVLRRQSGDTNTNSVVSEYSDLEYVMVDQLPPFDVVINFANEYGHRSQLVIFGIDISAEGQVMSIQDLITENTVQYTAAHMAVMTPTAGTKDLAGGGFGKKTFRSIMSSPSQIQEQLLRQSRNPFR